MTIRQAVSARGSRDADGARISGETKNEQSKRVVPLHSLALPALKAWKAEGWVRYVGFKPRPTDYVLPDPSGAAARPRMADIIRVDLAKAKCATKRGEDDIDFHATRRSFCTWLAANGVSGDTIDQLVGHLGASTRARHYTAAVLQVLRAAVETIHFDAEPEPDPAPDPEDAGTSPRPFLRLLSYERGFRAEEGSRGS